MRLVSAFVVVVVGCSLNSTGSNSAPDFTEDSAVAVDSSEVVIDSTPAIDSEVPDMTVVDTGAMEMPDSATADTMDSGIDSATDSGTVDSGSPEIGPIDTGVIDTGMTDSGMIDTGMIDTGMIDTGVMDTAVDAPGPSLTISTVGAPTFTLNLDTEGPRDWAHWGHTMSGSFNRKNGGLFIANGSRMGASAFESAVYHFGWTNGTPTASVTDTKYGLLMNNKDELVTFDVKGDPLMELTLDMWVSANSGTATVTASLSDASTGSAVTTYTTGVWKITFKYRTATAAGRMKVEVKKANPDGTANVFAAALK